MSKILVYELNEVPWRVADMYVHLRPNSNFARFLRDSCQFTTRTHDSGELHPWSTWPTMHRGVTNDAHSLRYINQDMATANLYPSVAELAVQQGKTVGIIGSLQQPLIHHNNVLFHIPDTFSKDPYTIPSLYQPFQEFNLRHTESNRATVSGVSLSNVSSAIGLLKIGVSYRSIMRVAGQLLREQLNKNNRALRPMMQAWLAFDVLFHCLKCNRPDYVSFFSNHVAGIMHRFWKYSFPEDFNYELTSSPKDQFHKDSITKAMDIFDAQLGILERFCQRYDYDLIVSSSMGQEAVQRGEYLGEFILRDFRQFTERLGLSIPVEMNMAMQPDISLEFVDEMGIGKFLSKIAKVTDSSGRRIVHQHYDTKGLTMSFRIGGTPTMKSDLKVLYEGVAHDVSDFGIEFFERDQGTGYHQPEGILAWKGDHAPKPDADRQIVDSRQYAPTILSALGATSNPYMWPSLYDEVHLASRIN